MMLQLNKSTMTPFFGISLAVVYGVFTRLLFVLQGTDALWGVVTIGFIVFVPLGLGAVTVAVLPRAQKTNWLVGVFAPWVTVILLSLVLLIFAIEIIICLVIALPIFLPLSSAGGVLAVWGFRRLHLGQVQMHVTLLLLLPYFISAVENQFPNPVSLRTVETQIVINAPPEMVWQQITSVRQIQPEEHHPSLFHLIGVPKPREAMMPEARIGAVRRSSYEGGIFFAERVFAVEPGHNLRFTIDLDPERPSPWPWNEIDGRNFVLVDAAYQIEVVDENTVILHLNSRHQIASKLNFYGSFWTDLIMGDIQDYILTVVKGRAELKSNPA